MIVVQDANILIDLYETDLLVPFLTQEFTSHSTDIVLYEIKQPVYQYVTNGLIQQHTLTTEQLDIVSQIQTTVGHGLSLPDCSVLWLTKELGDTARLLTGDNKLRQCAKDCGISVHGLLWILDQLVEKKIVSAVEMVGKLETIVNLGSRLPKDECQKRITSWQKQKVNHK